MESSVIPKGSFSKAKIFDCHQDFLVKYKLTREKYLGRGVSSEVFLASFREDPQEKRAVKVLAHSDVNAVLFVTETAILQKIEHENILTDIQAFRCRGQYILCMPYYPGGTLEQRLPRMTNDRVIKYFLQLTNAIRYLHAHGIAHRDVKPPNIVLDEDDDVILIDFGFAFHVKSKLGLRRVVGTTGYLPPEVYTLHQGQVDFFKCDMYALGAVLWNMVFRRVTPSSTDYLQFVHTNNLPVVYKTILHNLLHPDPETRWEARQLVKALYTFPVMSKMAAKLWGQTSAP